MIFMYCWLICGAIFSCFLGLCPKLIPELLWGRFWKQETPKESPILEPKIRIFNVKIMTIFWCVSPSRFGEDVGRFRVDFRGYFGYFFQAFSWPYVKTQNYKFLKDLPCILQDFEGSEGPKIHENQLPNRLKIALQKHGDSRRTLNRCLLNCWSQMGHFGTW